ncbi:hypothetical protein IGI04_037965 [Brassica rapa subsp. trilocularis]|uniref:C2 domain-containing protein n=1 Tax=Brassica rapa subsp. trilocularis TaxID=1813537 RepID=A0ABQ7LKI7_BRACM|nr:hypothetical protein IGI04_037965 [Brassica rapa subsp. trilocularis]
MFSVAIILFVSICDSYRCYSPSDLNPSRYVVRSTRFQHQKQQSVVSLCSKLANSWVTTTIFIFIFFILLLGASHCRLDMVAINTSTLQVSSIFSKNINKTTIPKIITKIPLDCTLLNNNMTQTCPSNYPTKFEPAISSSETCPDYFRWIQQDLKVWQETGITRETLERAKSNAHFRLVIKSGRLYVDHYDKAYQTRDVFTIWGILQLLRMYPGQVPDLELLFLCHDRPGIWKTYFRKEDNATWPPPPLFHYCGHRDAYDIVFPDWSFWGWPEVNIKEWNKLSVAIKEGNKKVKWEDRVPYAYWKGNPMVSIARRNFMTCNVSDKYDPMVRLYVQDWKRETRAGFKGSNLEDQCTHRYKIYIEGNAWSVSEKYILACDSMTLLIKPEFYDFFVRSMIPMEHYWPIRPNNCVDLKFAVEWGNNNTDKAQVIGRQGSEYMMKNLEMKYVYDYMLYMLQGYGKLMKLDVTVPENATEVCSETMACPITDGALIRQCMDDSLVMSPSVKPACDLPQPYGDGELKRFLEKQENAEREVEKWTDEYWEFVLGESRFQVTSVFTRNTNKSATTTTNIPKIIIKIPLNCTLLNNNTTQTCPSNYPTKFEPAISSSETCPDYFRWIHRDFKVWQKTGITRDTLEKARPHAHFRVVIKSGRLYVHQYEKAFQTRDVFTIWGILQLLRMYPGQIPDLELLFLCHDKPAIWKRDFKKDTWPPPPLFHYCGHRDAYDIVPELNIKEWNKLSVALKEGNKRVKWEDRIPYAYWKGNPNVSPVRGELMRCNFSDKYDPMVRLYVQDWRSEIEKGFRGSNLEDQCTHRYKIYVEGNAWSVSEKYILSCDSMTLLVKPEYYDFFIRSMVPMKHYWPIRRNNKCRDLKFAVEWGNNNTEKAQVIGRQGSDYVMQNLEMKYVYDYMLYVLQGYGKLMKLDVTVPENATEVCSETMACPITDGGLIRQCMDDSLVMSPSIKAACKLPKPYGDNELKRILKKQESVKRRVRKWTDEYWNFVLGESRFQVISVFTRNTNKSATTITTIPKTIPLNCTLLNNATTQTCPSNYPTKFEPTISSSETCPDYFRWIQQDLKVWQETGITRETLERAKPNAHFRVVIKSGRLYVDQYVKSYQTRDVFTIWGILQLLRTYPGQIPDLELLFLCYDKPVIWKRDFNKTREDTWPPPPLFRYCGHRDAYDIVFPDWSFWGWPEVNIKEWKKLSVALQEGNKRVKWKDRIPYAYWKGNPHVSTPIRKELMRCNFSDKYDPMLRLYAQAQVIGRQGSDYIMKNLEMKYVYDYMFYVLQGYGKLMKLDVTVPENATEVCSETMACPITDGRLIRQCMDDSLVMSPSVKAACNLPKPYGDYELKRILKKRQSAERKVMKWTDEKTKTISLEQKSMSNLKLCVEVISARLKPREERTHHGDGYGGVNASVELRFDGQIVKTSTKIDDASPVWNEKFFFNISDTEDLSNLILEAYVYNKTSSITKSCLGKIRIFGTAFVPYSEAVGMHYPLEKEKRSVFFSAVRGELALKVYVTDSPSLKVPIINPTKKVTSHTRHKFHNIPTTEISKPSQQRDPEPPQPQPRPPKQQSPQPRPPRPRSPQLEPLQTLLPQQPPVIGASRFQASRYDSPLPQAAMGYDPTPPDYSIKETNPILGGGRQARNTRAHDLVEPMEFLYVRVVKARNLQTMDPTGSLDPYVEVKLGNFTAKTKHFEKNKNPIWNEVFAFSKSDQQSNFLEVIVMDKDVIKDDFVGSIRFDLDEVPTRVAPDSPLAPEWYTVNFERGGEIMLAVWFGTQADEAFSDATYSDALTALNKSSVRSKIYHSPRLWYLRVNVIEAQDLVIVPDRTRVPNPYVKIKLGNQMVRTKSNQLLNPRWNEEFTLVAAEPFEDLEISIEDRVAVNREETLGSAKIPFDIIERRVSDNRIVPNRWFSLKFENQRRARVATTRILLNVCLEGGYHVLDESTYYSSDFRPSMKELWTRQQPSLGVLELGILGVEGLNMSHDGKKETVDAYCVAKYGTKWVRTRTVTNCFNPRFNEQYTWEVYEPATVITIGVFDNNQINGGNNKDGKIGKVRVRISTLESGRLYTNSYPLLVLRPSGVKNMGELHLAIRFTCTSMFQMLVQYWKPLLPKMHYVRPLKVVHQEILRQHAVSLVAARLSRTEPPLRKEVIEYITGSDSHFWSVRKSRANFFRLTSVLSCLLGTGEWFQDICTWKKPVASAAVHVLYLAFVCLSEMILPITSLLLFMLGVWNYRLRPRQPPHMDTRLSFADNVHPEELNEEFDTFPYSSQDPGTVKMRYERLRGIASRAQTVVGDIAGQGERVQALLSWRDPRATSIFMVLCLVSSVVLYVVPFKVFVLLGGLYIMRHPRFRRKTPPGLVNFFKRLPAKTDCML